MSHKEPLALNYSNSAIIRRVGIPPAIGLAHIIASCVVAAGFIAVRVIAFGGELSELKLIVVAPIASPILLIVLVLENFGMPPLLGKVGFIVGLQLAAAYAVCFVVAFFALRRPRSPRRSTSA